MASKKIRGISLDERKQLYGYAFVSPFLIGFLLFFIAPFLFYISMSFSKMTLTNEGLAFINIGFENYKNIFTTKPEYMVNVWNSVTVIGVQLFTTVLYSLFVAILLNQKFKGRFLVRAIFFLPVIVASGVAAISSDKDILVNNAYMLLSGMADNTSVKMSANIAETIIALFGTTNITHGFVSFVTSIVSGIYDITQASGVQILIFLAGLQTISPSLYEASKIDGATGWENFWKITLPMISPMILVNAIYTIVDSLSSINNITVSLIYQTAAKDLDYTKSAAMGILYFSIVLTTLAVAMVIMSRFVYYENKVEKERKWGIRA